MPELRVDRVGQVDRCRSGRQSDDPALGGEDENLVRVEIRRQRLDKLTRVLRLALPIKQAVQPGQALQASAVRGRPDRACDDPGFREAVHSLRTDLDIDGFAGRVHNGRMQGLVHVELGSGHEVA